MALYKVYFEIYGRKMKTRIEADNEQDAIRKVKQQLEIRKVERVAGLDDLPEGFKEAFGLK